MEFPEKAEFKKVEFPREKVEESAVKRVSVERDEYGNITNIVMYGFERAGLNEVAGMCHALRPKDEKQGEVSPDILKRIEQRKIKKKDEVPEQCEKAE
jgi:hypothetical protein